MDIHRRAGLERHDMADRTSSEYASDKAWNSLLLMAATSSPKQACARSCSTSPITRYCQVTIMGGAAYPRAFPTRDLRGRGVAQGRPTGKPTVEGSDITTCSGRPASLACSGDLQLIRWRGTRDHLLALSRPSPLGIPVVSWEALARLPRSSLTRVCWTCPARESTVGTCSPRPPSGRSRAARPPAAATRAARGSS